MFRYPNQGRVNQSLPPTSRLSGLETWIATTAIPATTTAEIATNLVTTKKLFNRVLAFVLIEFATLMTMRVRTESSLCSILPAWSVIPAAEKMLSTKTMLRIARVAGITATTHVHAARKPYTSPKMNSR